MELADRLRSVQERIASAARRAGRRPEDVVLMGVSKLHPAAAVREAYRAGLRLFGESRVGEAAAKFPPLLQELEGVELHMIGSLQRNKAKNAVGLFSCVQSLDREELAVELSKRAEAAGTTIDVLFELHTGEDSKAGFPDVPSLAKVVETALSLPGLRIRGLMTMAPWVREEEPIRRSFRTLSRAREFLASRFPEVDWSVLSMGMSNDFELAVEEGSTLLRVGTAIFGAPEEQPR